MNYESVKLKFGTLVQGEWHDEGDSVAVQDFQKRHLVAGGYVDGGLEDIASQGEKDQGALNVLKKADQRDDIDPWSIERAHREGFGYGASDPHDEASQPTQDEAPSAPTGPK